MLPVQLKHPIARATPFRLFICGLLVWQFSAELLTEIAVGELLRLLGLLLWTTLSVLARYADTPRVALLLHVGEAAFLPLLVEGLPQALAMNVMLIAIAGSAASGGWRFLLPCLFIMCAVATLVPGASWQPGTDTLLTAGFLLPLALVSFTQAQRLHSRGHRARSRSENLSRANARLETYLPQPVVKRIRHGEMARQAPCTSWISVVFVDLVGFSGYVRARPVEEIVAVVDDYQGALSALAAEHTGVLGKFLGDGALIYFPTEIAGLTIESNQASALKVRYRVQQAYSALQLAQQLPILLNTLNCRWQGQGYLTRMQQRCGVASGYCALGDWGSIASGRLDHCIIGDPVNLASRLQSAAVADGTLVCAVTAALAEHALSPARDQAPMLGTRQELELKGLGHSVAYPLVDAAISHL